MIKVRHRHRINPKLCTAAVAIGLIALIVLLVIFMHGSEAVTGNGYISVDIKYNAVIVRDELAVTESGFDHADYFVNEGQYAEAGTHVMDVYRRGYSEELMLSLQRTEREIYEAQLAQLGEARDSVLNGHNEKVAYLQNRIAEDVMTDRTGEIASLEAQLQAAVEARSEYLTTAVQETEALRTLYRAKKNKEDLIGTWRESLSNDRAGVISFYFDDYENALNEDKLSIMTSDLIRSILKGKGAVEWTTKAENLAYRIVDTSHWYCVYITEAKQALRTVEGMGYKIDVDGFGQFEATAMEPIISGNYAINILRVDHDMGELINVRTVGVSVNYDASGIKVKLDGITVNDSGERFIEFIYGDERSRLEIVVLSADKNNAVIRAKNSDEQAIDTGVRYWIPKKTSGKDEN